jgi:hypothetical protein
MPQVLVVDNAQVPAWPNVVSARARRRSRYVELSEAIATQWETDAHAAQYEFPAVPRRLDNGALVDDLETLTDRIQAKSETLSRTDATQYAQQRLDVLRAARADSGGGVPMVAVYFDIDLKPISDEWRAIGRDAAKLLFRVQPGYYAETKNGARFIYELGRPFMVSGVSSAAEWTETYKQWLAYISRVTGLPIIKNHDGRGLDPACADWTRLVRLPHATREGESLPERRTVFGDLAPWDPPLTDHDRSLIAKRAAERGSSGQIVRASDGLFACILEARGWRKERKAGGWVTRCPNAAHHSDGRDGTEGSTLVYPATDQQPWGNISCKHGHCQDLLKTADWLRAGYFEHREILDACAKLGLNPDATQKIDDLKAADEYEKYFG